MGLRLPQFPPIIEEWLPPPPIAGPPLPKFLRTNPGLWSEYTKDIPGIRNIVKSAEEKAGLWATHRGAAMLTKADIASTKLEGFARDMYERMLYRVGVAPAPIPVIKKPKIAPPTEVKPKPTMEMPPPVKEELKPAPAKKERVRVKKEKIIPEEKIELPKPLKAPEGMEQEEFDAFIDSIAGRFIEGEDITPVAIMSELKEVGITITVDEARRIRAEAIRKSGIEQ